MPELPSYHGKLPRSLNPFKAADYLLLAFWVFFRPSGLKHYLYQADPELYWAKGWSSAGKALRMPAYRNLWLMVPILVLVLSVVFGSLTLIAVEGLGQENPDWFGWATVFIQAVFAGTAVCISVGLIFGALFGVAGGMAFGVVAGITGGLATGLRLTSYGGITFGLALGMTISSAFGLAGGVVVGVVVGLLLAGALSLQLSDTFINVAVGLGVLRIVFYPVELLLACFPRRAGYPSNWDELCILPLPGSEKWMRKKLAQGEVGALVNARRVLANPFQRGSIQRALRGFLTASRDPLAITYRFLSSKELTVVIGLPTTRPETYVYPSILQVMFGEVAGQYVAVGEDSSGRLTDRLAWWITRSYRDRSVSPLFNFARMIDELLDEHIVSDHTFRLETHRSAYQGVRDYPHGDEIEATFEYMARFLSYSRLDDLPRARSADVSAFSAPLRLAVIAALEGLRLVSAEVQACLDSTSRASKQAALLRAADGLKRLNDEVDASVFPPEKYLLQRIIRQWLDLVIEAGGKVGRVEISGPVQNPYVAGNPVIGDLFVGREDVLRRLEELWSGEGQKPSVVLYGHRRMGKSSILQNLKNRFGQNTRIVDFNLQRVGYVKNTGEFLHALALALYDALSPDQQSALAEPGEDAYLAHNPFTAFDRFLKTLERIRGDFRFLITIDEFELLEGAIAAGTIEARVIDYWRGLIHTYPWFILALAGLHELEEKRRDYWNPLFGSVTAVRVSFLSPEATERLLSQPSPDFSLDYDRDAPTLVYDLTNGQPFLVQLIGHALVSRYNRQNFEEGQIGEPRLTAVDVRAVIAAHEFFADGDAYFTGIWRQAESGEVPGQTAILEMLAKSEPGLSTEQLVAQSNLTAAQVEAALQALQRHDVIHCVDGEWRFTVALMRRWVAMKN